MRSTDQLSRCIGGINGPNELAKLGSVKKLAKVHLTTSSIGTFQEQLIQGRLSNFQLIGLGLILPLEVAPFQAYHLLLAIVKRAEFLQADVAYKIPILLNLVQAASRSNRTEDLLEIGRAHV
jgi:hypothetical protein